MRLLFEIDKKDYEKCTQTLTRNSARSIIIRDGKIAMIHSLKYDYYKFPGGGINDGEDPVDAMIRETREEAGLIVIKESVKEYGYVHRIQKSKLEKDTIFIQDNLYYLCSVEGERVAQELDDYEVEELFKLEYIDPQVAIDKNHETRKTFSTPEMLEREERVLEMIISEHLF